MSALIILWATFILYAIIDWYWKMIHAKVILDLYVRVGEIEEHENDPLP